MTITIDDMAARPGPRYRALADSLEAAIRRAELGPGDRLPPQRDLAHALDVTVGTVGRAYGLLLQRGLARGEVGRGTFVQEPGRRDADPLGHASPAPGRGHDLAVNRPVAVPAHDQVFRIIEAIGRDGRLLAELLTYPPHAGRLEHRRALARWLETFAGPIDPAQVLPCLGTQNGMAVALAAVTRPGDILLMEAVAYPSNLGLAGRLGLKVEPVAMDAEGALPESIEAVCRQHRPTAIVLSPDLHNPTFATASVDRREAIAAVARRHDLQIIEDAVYAPVAGTGLPLLRGLAPERTHLVTSISKFLAPGLRVGCVVAPPDRLHKVVTAQAHLSLGVPPLIAETFARLEADGTLALAMDQQRAALERRRAVALEALHGLPVTSGTNALHVLLDLPAGHDATATARQLEAVGLRTTPFAAFTIGRGQIRPALRLSLGGAIDEADLASALTSLREHVTLGLEAPPVI